MKKIDKVKENKHQGIECLMSGKKVRTVLIILVYWISISVLKAQTVYIDPTYTGGGNNGTASKPYTSWANVSIKSQTTYLQKRGTTCDVSKQLSVTQLSNVKFGVYGSGEAYANIVTSATAGAVFQFTSCYHCSIDSFDLSAIRSAWHDTLNTITGVSIGDNSWSGLDTNFIAYNVNVHNINLHDLSWAIRIMSYGANTFDTVFISNVKADSIMNDGFFIQAWGTYHVFRGLQISNCYIQHVNIAYNYISSLGKPVSQENAGGDGIQISRIVDGWSIKNCTIDRRGSSFKFCIIDNDESGSGWCSGIISNNTLYAADQYEGGEVSYLGSLNQVVFCYNTVYCNSVSEGIMTRWGTSLKCYYNLFLGTGSSIPATFFDIGSGPVEIQNNTFYGTDQVIKLTGGSNNVSVNNNIFCNAGQVYNSITGITRSNNLYYNSTTWDGNESGALLNTNPDFADPQNTDFHLQIGSPAIAAGISLGYTMDLTGSLLTSDVKPDLGAFQTESESGVTAVPETEEKNKLQVFPNPAVDHVMVGLPDAGEIKLINLQGKILYEQKNEEGNITMDLPFSAGVYILYFLSEDNQVQTAKLIIRK